MRPIYIVKRVVPYEFEENWRAYYDRSKACSFAKNFNIKNSKLTGSEHTDGKLEVEKVYIFDKIINKERRKDC